MTSDADDDRTIIRPAGSPKPAPALAGAAAAPPAMGGQVGSTAGPRTGAPAAPASTTVEQHHNALPVGTYLGEFEVQGIVGEGGFGIVYLAWDHSLERRVALKEYMPSALAARAGDQTVSVKSERHRETFQAGLSSFVNEARLLAQFDHPSLVKVYRFWEANGTAYMVMPFYEGVTLKDTLRALGGPPDEDWLMGMLAPLTEALEVIHAEQCYHRDIAPDNVILLKGSQRPLLLDFGAARRVIGDMTQALTVILKPGYAPVEQYAEVPGMKQGPWTDVYALAALVYNAITGKTPPTSVGRLMADHYQPLAEVARGRYSDNFLQAMDRALKVKPEERTQNIGQLRAELGLAHTAAAPVRTVMGPGAGAGAAPPGRAEVAANNTRDGGTAAPSGGQAAKGKGALWAGLGVGALALAGGAAWWVMQGAPAGSNAAAIQAGSANASAASVAGASAAAPAVPAVGGAPYDPAAATQGATGTAGTAGTASVPGANLSGPFEPHEEFARIEAAARTDFEVKAAPSKPQFRIGRDRLGFSITSARDGHVYVLLQSTDGAFLRLFPNSMAKNNRIQAGQTLKLPDANWPMDTAGPAGTDHFLVIVSEHPRDFDIAGLKMDGGFGELPVGDEALAVLRRHPAGLSPFAGRPQCPGGGECEDVFGATRFSSEEIP